MDHAYLTGKKNGGLFKSTLLSLLFSFLFGAAAILVSAAVLLRFGNPTGGFRALGMLLPALTALLGGIVSGKADGKQGALAGLLHGLLFVLTLFLLSLLFGEGDLSLAYTLISYTIMLLLSVLGGLLGASARGKKKKRRHGRR